MVPLSGSKAVGIIDMALTALVKAWAATLIATTLLVAALAVAQVWDGAAYVRALPGALSPGV
jgi:hypothetical protein